MIPLPEVVKQEVIKLVPTPMLNSIACFVFYDNHPRDQKHIDVTIVTKDGEIREYYKRELANALLVHGRYQPTAIKILRNSNCEMFYFLVAGDELTLVSRKERLSIHRRILNVATYSLDDNVCRGRACLKVICKDDAVPMVFDDNFENLGDKALLLNGINADDSIPILNELKRKLTQTKFSVKCNESTLKEFLSLRQVSALSAYQKIYPSNEAVFNTNTNKMDDVLILKSHTPYVAPCDNQIIVVLIVSYCNDQVPIEDVHILVHGTLKPTTVYTTKLYDRINTSPFWQERKTNTLLNDHDVAVVGVIDIFEVVKNMHNTVQFHGVIAYRRLGKEYMVPFDEVVRIQELFSYKDILGTDVIDEMVMLPLIAVAHKTKLVCRYLREADDPPLVFPDSFATHMSMVPVQCDKNTIIYKEPPLYLPIGCILVFKEEEIHGDIFSVTAFVRKPDQIVQIMGSLCGTVNAKMIVTTPRLRVTSKLDKNWRFNEETTIPVPNLDYDQYASAIVKQTNLVIEYFDYCMAKMNESKDVEVKNKIGTEIDLFAGGQAAYLEFRKKLLDLALTGAKSMKVTEETTLSSLKAGSEMVTD
ncbi:uncharacterized protein LOC135079686 [Ostrinia nubilalis]|uniref:uncharacterized protein LOC135079686 n=1 Tax=Ostrinia nubilalis TaxID=29057 RepID=UPI003082207C